jgi:hypothetical protein
MKTSSFLPLIARFQPARPLLGFLFALLAAALPLATGNASPSWDAGAGSHERISTLSGLFKIHASTDPLFPMNDSKEWFMDFGKGMSKGKWSGTVAVSMRQNPHVRVRILVWQVLPDAGVLRIGNQTAQGSGQAVMRGEWRMARAHAGVVLQRGDHHVLLRPAGPLD